MFGGFLQSMGTASKLIRLMILVLIAIIIVKLWYHVFPSSLNMPPPIQVIPLKNEVAGLKAIPHQTERLDVAVLIPIHIAVYYEALCPDSRHFISHQLLPAYDAFSDIIHVDLIPYGKARTHASEDGKTTFHCQHGPSECQANLVHACVVKYLSNQRRRLDAVRCMIEANTRDNDPIQVGRKCVAEYKDVDWATMEKCSKGSEGEGLLSYLGKMTHDLNPKITFIPSITIDGSQKNQQLILRSLKKVICTVYSGPKHSACDT